MESQLETENVCSLSKRKKEPKFKMNTYFNSNVIWLQLEYKISTLVLSHWFLVTGISNEKDILFSNEKYLFISVVSMVGRDLIALNA